MLSIYPSLANAPKFYIQKNKAPNVKEQAVLNKLDLKRKNFLGLRTLDFDTPIKSYGIVHKLVKELAVEANYYESVIKILAGENPDE